MGGILDYFFSTVEAEAPSSGMASTQPAATSDKEPDSKQDNDKGEESSDNEDKDEEGSEKEDDEKA